MALVLKDRVKETTSTVGTGAISLGGAVTNFQAFSAVEQSHTQEALEVLADRALF